MTKKSVKKKNTASSDEYIELLKQLHENFEQNRLAFEEFVRSNQHLSKLEKAEAWLKYVSENILDNSDQESIVLAVLAAGVYFIVKTVRESAAAAANAATAPFQQVNQANQALQTQVAQMINPTPTIIPDPITYINNIRALARLETIQYSAEQVVTCELNQNGLLGYAIGDKLLFVGHGEVIAGIDMEKIQPGDMTLQGGTLFVKLPPAELFIVTLNNEKSYVYDRVTGPLAPTNMDLETACRQAAEEKIRTAVLEDGILMQAQSNAENYFYRFFTEQLGYDKVQFVR